MPRDGFIRVGKDRGINLNRVSGWCLIGEDDFYVQYADANGGNSDIFHGEQATALHRFFLTLGQDIMDADPFEMAKQSYPMVWRQSNGSTWSLKDANMGVGFEDREGLLVLCEDRPSSRFSPLFYWGNVVTKASLEAQIASEKQALLEGTEVDGNEKGKGTHANHI